MPAYGIVGFSQPNTLIQPSGSIWGNCVAQELLDLGVGYFTYQTFVDVQTLPGLPSSAANSGTFTQATGFDHALTVTTGASASNGAIVNTRPTNSITPGSGKFTWFEAAISKANVALADSIFVGLVNKVGMTNALIQASSGTLNSNLLTSVSGTSVIGFWANGSTKTNFDAVYVKAISGTGGVTPSTVPVVLANVLTANANNPNPGNPSFVPATPPGALVNDQFLKLGLYYDGQKYLYWFVNGTQVAKLEVGPTNIDITSTYGGVVAFATGAGSSTLNVHFFRSASEFDV